MLPWRPSRVDQNLPLMSVYLYSADSWWSVNIAWSVLGSVSTLSSHSFPHGLLSREMGISSALQEHQEHQRASRASRAPKNIKKRESRTLRISRKNTKKGHGRTLRQKHQEHQEYPEPFSSHALLIKSYLNNFLGKSLLPNHLPSNPSSEVCYNSAETALWLPGWKNSLKPVSSLAFFPFSLPWNKVWL